MFYVTEKFRALLTDKIPPRHFVSTNTIVSPFFVYLLTQAGYMGSYPADGGLGLYCWRPGLVH